MNQGHPMSRRRLIILSIGAIAVVSIGLGILAVLPPQPGVTKANFDRIEKGMTLADVEAILGSESMSHFDHGESGPLISREIWHGVDRSSTRITFDDGIVCEKQWRDSTETLTDKLRRWLHLPK